MMNYNEFTANLMVYSILVNDDITDEELDCVNNILYINYSPEVAEEIFSIFTNNLNRPTEEIEIELISYVRQEQMLYDNRIKTALLAYQIFASDTIDSLEFEKFNYICNKINIQDEDVDIINSLMIGEYELNFPENENQKVSFGDSFNYDVYMDGVHFELFYINNKPYLVNILSQEAIFINDQHIESRTISPICPGDIIEINTRTISAENIPFYFEALKKDIQDEFFFTFDKEKDFLKITNEYDSDIKCKINKCNIVIYDISQKYNLSTDYGLISDYQVCDLLCSLNINGNASINLSSLVLHGKVEYDFIDLSNNTTQYFTISNKDKNADFIINDNEQDKLHITIERKNTYGRSIYTIFPEEIPYDIYLNNVILEENTSVKCEKDSTLIIDKNQILLDTSKGNISQNELLFESFEVKNLHYRFKDGNIGIKNVSFSTYSGEMNAIMGSSGSGKNDDVVSITRFSQAQYRFNNNKWS